ncbi:hypothetical protein KGV55_01145 [Candidatus Gracilibacteria bacterium]|nr:hypothetical protein [Candidatus Gracilibacteria bacterium]
MIFWVEIFAGFINTGPNPQIAWSFITLTALVFTAIFLLIDRICPQSIFFVGLYLPTACIPVVFYIFLTLISPEEWTVSENIKNSFIIPLHSFFQNNTWLHWFLLALILIGYFFLLRFLKKILLKKSKV